ncbi:unnamed protein product [Acanthoscelides obtectus]|uniref:Uncharacterized protein n=1 Tax=Acanthoscelides obtectus TaxID=200917 RepID=A0A9P0LD80_ACAOB|nr:unnamed protein product [Acanthoscelides obtectus]CAK1671755.1 hypothetical protein AOBTE_LOCUS28437 [Acanthoscelides obtectus]
MPDMSWAYKINRIYHEDSNGDVTMDYTDESVDEDNALETFIVTNQVVEHVVAENNDQEVNLHMKYAPTSLKRRREISLDDEEQEKGKMLVK